MKERAFLFFYSAITLCASFIAMPFFLLHPRGRRRLNERIGLHKFNSSGECIWIHAASLGELKGLEPLLLSLKPEVQLIFSSVSVTALDYADKSNYFIDKFLLPFDHVLFLNRIFANYKIKAFIFAETEIWPNLMRHLNQRGTLTIMLNAKVLEGSFRWYSIFKTIFAPLFAKLDLVCVGNMISMERFKALGASSERMFLTGNMKYSIHAPSNSSLAYTNLFTESRATLVLASIRKGEFEFFIDALNNLKSRGQFWNIVIVPRQLEDRQYFINLLNNSSYKYELYSQSQPVKVESSSHSFILIDKIGLLMSLYPFGDLVFVGGSLVKGYGGHNPLEPALFNKLIFLGTYTENVDDLIAREPNAFYRVSNSSDIESLLLSFKDEKYQVYRVKAKHLSTLFLDAPIIVKKHIDQVLKCS